MARLALREEAQQELAALDDPPARPLDMLSLECCQAIVLGKKLKPQPELDAEKNNSCLVPASAQLGEHAPSLLLQRKLNTIKHQVAVFPELQRKLLALIDSWCQPGFHILYIAK
ncbi:exonuclease mut-7 homolog [Microtus oregoni]|uniref:exonuclease mut-7 homolog n=1 Tax=Microtus oregoni TaxID=111838 RepID=UPI001BB18BE5|nr:exonuclease mut-7 homolog [Microtus oregoni]